MTNLPKKLYAYAMIAIMAVAGLQAESDPTLFQRAKNSVYARVYAVGRWIKQNPKPVAAISAVLVIGIAAFLKRDALFSLNDKTIDNAKNEAKSIDTNNEKKLEQKISSTPEVKPVGEVPLSNSNTGDQPEKQPKENVKSEDNGEKLSASTPVNNPTIQEPNTETKAKKPTWTEKFANLFPGTSEESVDGVPQPRVKKQSERLGDWCRGKMDSVKKSEMWKTLTGQPTDLEISKTKHEKLHNRMISDKKTEEHTDTNK